LGPVIIFWYRASGEPWMYLVFGTVSPEYQIGISLCCGHLVAISWFGVMVLGIGGFRSGGSTVLGDLL